MVDIEVLKTVGIAVLLIFVGIFYSLLINISYGHQTFWRDISGLLTPLRSQLISSSFLGKGKNILSMLFLVRKKIATHSHNHGVVWSNHSLLRRNKVLEDPVTALSKDIVYYIFRYLSVEDLCKISIVDKRWRSVAGQSSLWEYHYRRLLLEVIATDQKLATSLKLENGGFDSYVALSFNRFSKAEFRKQYFQLRESVLTSSSRLNNTPTIDAGRESCRVLVNGDIYDLTLFLDEHPGGTQILQEWNGQDASFVFSAASHSRYAMQRANSFLIWSSRRLLH